MRNQFPDLSVALGGQTGIDIGPKGADKSQILRDFSDDDELHFFGDRIEEGGNDYSLAKEVKKRNGYTYHVRNYNETQEILRNYEI